jgi:hypothetical protein
VASPVADSLAPLFGWAFLGLSGAYLLRALTESGVVPGLVGAVAGIVYAGFWLVLAAQRSWEKPLASSVHGITAALIIAPMLWETTVRFHLMSVEAASVVLVCFAVFGLAIGWRHNVTAIAWVATLVALVTAFGIFRESHDGRAWVLTVLAIATAVEFSACRDHWLSLRWLAALTADMTVLTLTVIATRRYPLEGGSLISPAFVLGAQVALVSIYLASTIDRTLIRKLPFTWFEIGQAVAAFLVGVGGALHLADATNIGRTPVGLICLAGAAACYAVSFAMLDRDTQRNRNFYTYSTFGIVLVIAGCSLVFPEGSRAIAWAIIAVGMMAAGVIAGRTTLRVHATVCLVLATAGSESIPRAAAWLSHAPVPYSAGLDLAVFAVFASASLCYAVIRIFGKAEAHLQMDALLAAAILTWTGVGLAAAGLAEQLSPAPPLRSALLTLTSLCLAWSSSRWEYPELSWLAYGFLCAAGVKLLLEDLHQSESFAIFSSLMLFGCTLILLPRILRLKRRYPAPAGIARSDVIRN